MSGFIYMWINTVNNKKYIGSHIGSEDDGYIGSGPIFLRAVNKYGIESFERVILERVSERDKVFEREEHYLKLFNVANDKQFYNVRDRAGGGFDYVNNGPLAEEYKAKRVAKQKEWYANNEHPKGMRGKSHSEDTKRKQREATLANKQHTYRPVLQYDLAGNFVAEYESITHAARAVRGIPSNIKYTIEGKFKTAYKHVWKYK